MVFGNLTCTLYYNEKKESKSKQRQSKEEEKKKKKKNQDKAKQSKAKTKGNTMGTLPRPPQANASLEYVVLRLKLSTKPRTNVS